MNTFTFTAFCKKILQANNVDPDQTPRSAASELGLLCLHNTQKWTSGLKRGKDPDQRPRSAVSEVGLHCLKNAPRAPGLKRVKRVPQR